LYDLENNNTARSPELTHRAIAGTTYLAFLLASRSFTIARTVFSRSANGKDASKGK
jgi:hypothetical protein